MDRHLILSEIISILNQLEKEPRNKITRTEILTSLERKFHNNNFTGMDKAIANEEIHLLLINNILMIAEEGVAQREYLSLTTYGKECLKKGDIVSLDSMGYLEQIKISLSKVDPVILDYLSESITAFNRGLILSSTITLGVASEKAMLLLLENFCIYIENSNLKNYIPKLTDQRFISQKYDSLKEALEKLPKEVKNELPDNYEITIDTMFNFIKINRDATGHPKGGGKDKLLQGAYLQAFKSYLTTIYKLIDYFKSNKLQVELLKETL